MAGMQGFGGMQVGATPSLPYHDPMSYMLKDWLVRLVVLSVRPSCRSWCAGDVGCLAVLVWSAQTHAPLLRRATVVLGCAHLLLIMCL
jgi:hypothetical protein